MSTEQLLALHTKAEENMKLKLAKIPPRVLGNTKLQGIYAGMAKFPPRADIPADLPLQFLFDNFDELQRSGFTMKKDQENRDLNRFVFYYETDKHRSCNAAIEQIRLNLITMSILFLSPGFFGIGKYYQIGLFCSAFMRAWIESVTKEVTGFAEREHFLDMWAKGPYDLIKFKRSQCARLRHRLKELRHEPLPGDLETRFVRMAEGRVTEVEFREQGAKLAVQWCFHGMNAAQEEENKAKAEEASKPGVLEGALAGMSLDSEPFTVERLAHVNWNDPGIQALLRDPDPTIEPQESAPKEDSFWISAKEAEELLMVSMDDLQALLEKWKI